MSRTLSAVAREVQGRLVGADHAFGAVTTDTRSLGPGSLFVAIPGDRFDGNDFVDEAFAEEGGRRARLAAWPPRRCRKSKFATRAARWARWREHGARRSRSLPSPSPAAAARPP